MAKQGTAENEYMHESIEKDAVKLDLPADEIITALCLDNKDLAAQLKEIRLAATKWPRCCDLWQDGLGGMHCTPCGQKTFAMLGAVQRLLGVNKGCKPIN